MGKGLIMRQGLYYIVSVIFTIITCIILHQVLLVAEENQARQQARDNLKQIKFCYVSLIKTRTFNEAANICTAKVRIGTSGDVYILNMETKEFVFENSDDVPSNMFFTKESVGEYFYSWTSGELALNKMLLGKNSTIFDKVSYQFNEEPEWLEWIYLPDDVKGLEDRLIAVQGVQAEEIREYYRTVEYMLFGTTGLAIFVLLILYKQNERYARGDIICPYVKDIDAEHNRNC